MDLSPQSTLMNSLARTLTLDYLQQIRFICKACFLLRLEDYQLSRCNFQHLLYYVHVTPLTKNQNRKQTIVAAVGSLLTVKLLVWGVNFSPLVQPHDRTNSL